MSSGGHIEWKPTGEAAWRRLPIESFELSMGQPRTLPREPMQASVLIAPREVDAEDARILADCGIAWGQP